MVSASMGKSFWQRPIQMKKGSAGAYSMAKFGMSAS
jgi:hypothetical protein